MGGSSSAWTNAANWSGGNMAPTGGTYNARVQIQSGANNPLIYSADQGYTIYEATNISGATPRALLVGNTAPGEMRITGGTFETRGSSPDLISGNNNGTSTLLISILMPALSSAQRQSLSVKCQSNLRTVGMHLLMYANDNKGQMIPLGEKGKHLGSGVPREERWPKLVFRPAVWNPPVMLCPADVEPAEEHSYILNIYLQTGEIKFGKTKGASPSEIIVMGEKKSAATDYHMDPGQFDTLVEQYRHGLFIGSNYLYMDGHAKSSLPLQAKRGLEPWNPLPEGTGSRDRHNETCRL